jgi:hypothetical protein
MKDAQMTSRPKSPEAQFDRPRGRFVEVTFGDVVQILAMINSHGQSKKLQSKTKGEAHKLRIPSATVIAVKELIAAHPEMRRSSLGKRVLHAKKPKRPLAEEAPVAMELARGTSSVATGNDECCDIGGTGG